MITSQAPLPSTFGAIEAEVFQARTKHPTQSDLVLLRLPSLIAEVSRATTKIERDLWAVTLAAACVRIIEEVK